MYFVMFGHVWGPSNVFLGPVNIKPLHYTCNGPGNEKMGPCKQHFDFILFILIFGGPGNMKLGPHKCYFVFDQNF